MMCFMCKGTSEDKKTTFMVDLDDCIIIIKNVPSNVCSQCGEITYSDHVAEKIDNIVRSVRNSMVEITVINYDDTDQAA